MPFLIASTNGHKIRHIRACLQKIKSSDIFSLLEFPNYTPPEETEATLKENAILKAKHAARELHMWTIGDDSGLIVPALSGAPGVYSARYAGPQATDKENRAKLLQQMRHLDEEQRGAVFECYLALVNPKAELITCVHGSCEGTITHQEKGSSGFGYDPLFKKYDYNQTFAELDERVKNQVSHRAKALAKLLLYLENSPEII